ncbi:MAG: hypothetical protein H7X94_00355 [Vallitaleaceae bacterium]|nr:hypothetical protein [Vallitaleaceae bacterium]
MNQSILRTNGESYLNPLFWVHGEEEAVIRNEIKVMSENGIGSFTVESRPHPEYLQKGWWRDLDIIIDEAKKRKMKVWLYDDCGFPSGSVSGELVKKYPEYRKKFLRIVHIDSIGPLKGSSFLIRQWLKKDESVVAVVAAARSNLSDVLLSDTLIDITDHMVNGVVYWDLPEGSWRVFVLIKSLNCAEELTENHLNPLEKEAVGAFIKLAFEPTYEHLKQEFGETLQGFFTDEPRFGNYPSYSAKLGTVDMPIPYSTQIINISFPLFSPAYFPH